MSYFHQYGSNDSLRRSTRPWGSSLSDQINGSPNGRGWPTGGYPSAFPERHYTSRSSPISNGLLDRNRGKSQVPENKDQSSANNGNNSSKSKRDVSFYQRVKRGAQVFAQTCSIGGLSYIESSTTAIRRLAWTIVFLGFLSITTWHLSTLVQTYRSWPTETKVTIKTGVVDFPSVTVCNLNIIRSSQLYLNPELEAFVNSSSNSSFFGSLNDQSDFDYSDFYEDNSAFSADDFFSGVDDPELTAYSRFRELLGHSNVSTRERMGHQKELMIIDCTFNGKICHEENFTHSFNRDYGNCFTFNSAHELNDSLKTRFVGPEYGLSIELFKEDREYLSSFTTGGGWRIAVHPFDTLSFPFVSGLSVAPNAETFVGLRYTELQRPGDPYEACDDGKYFRNNYDALYTFEACQATCIARATLANCSCYLPENFENYPWTGITTRVEPCNTTQRQCSDTVASRINLGQHDCGCLKACSEKEMSQAVSFHQWPDIGLVDKMIEKVCAVDEEGLSCQDLMSQQNDSSIQSQFGRLNVYLKTLSTEVITESGSYGLSRFASDIGGTIGLWLGLSVFSVIEIINFVMHLCKYVYYSAKRVSGRTQPNRYFDRQPPMRSRDNWMAGYSDYENDYPRRRPPSPMYRGYGAPDFY